MLRVIIIDNGTQFNCKAFKEFCQKLRIDLCFASVAHPQTNGQTESAKKSILSALKKKLDDKKGRWAEEIPSILWSYRTTYKEATGETPYRMTYGTEAAIPLEVQMSSLRLEHFHDEGNDEGLRLCLDTIDEVHDMARTKMIAQKQAVARKYNSKVKKTFYQLGDWVLRKAEFTASERREGKLGANCEGPYRIVKILAPGT